MKHRIREANRREFLKTAAALAACPYIIPASALGADDATPPSERIVMAAIGVGNRGREDLDAMLPRKDVQFVAVCDVKKVARERDGKGRVDKRYANTDCKTYADFRDVLARNDIDALLIATPDHWHAILVVEACRAGKDVYCEKPESLTIRQGRAMVEAARRYGRVVSGGSQRVLDDYGKIARRCWSGEMGTIKEIYVNVGGPSTVCNLPGEPVPEDLDWDMWLGPAPWAPYHPYRISGSYNVNGTSWRSWKDYSGGLMTDWGAHKFGGAMFCADVREQGPVEIVPPDGQEHKYLGFRFANGLTIYHSPGRKDTDVTPVGTPGETLPAKPFPSYKGTGGIYGDFFHCVRTRETPFRDIELGHRSVTICHLGNIAYELQRPLKWDPVKEEFPGDEEANRFLDRAMREPWQL
jgi:hypothetical protein